MQTLGICGAFRICKNKFTASHTILFEVKRFIREAKYIQVSATRVKLWNFIYYIED